jgi:S-adenosylmethionine hydrolase
LNRLIALITDFGSRDAYAGILKGVIAQIAPGVTVIDITHAIPSGDVYRAAFELWRSVPYFPKKTVFLVVVDPGVGTGRRAIAFEFESRLFVGPDNGCFTFLLHGAVPDQAIELTESSYHLKSVSHTFHGRDIFAPAAAHLARGVALEKFGQPIDDIFSITLPLLEEDGENCVKGEILHADHFGNLITSIGILQFQDEGVLLAPWLPSCPSTSLPSTDVQLLLPNQRALPLQRTFKDVLKGEALAYIGSAGLVEIAINQGNASEVLGLEPGQEISIGLKG